MPTTMRAKFVVTAVESTDQSEKLRFSAVAKNGAYPEDGSDEDNTFAKFSPQASCEITIANPALFGKFTAGDRFYVDFTPAE